MRLGHIELFVSNPQTAAASSACGLQFNRTDSSDECLTFTDPDGHWFQLVNPNHT